MCDSGVIVVSLAADDISLYDGYVPEAAPFVEILLCALLLEDMCNSAHHLHNIVT